MCLRELSARPKITRENRGLVGPQICYYCMKILAEIVGHKNRTEGRSRGANGEGRHGEIMGAALPISHQGPGTLVRAYGTRIFQLTKPVPCSSFSITSLCISSREPSFNQGRSCQYSHKWQCLRTEAHLIISEGDRNPKPASGCCDHPSSQRVSERLDHGLYLSFP